MQKAVRFADAHLPWFVLAVVGLGLAFPAAFTSFRGLLSLFMGLMTFASTLGNSFADLAGVFRRPVRVLVALGILHIAMPLASLALGWLLFPEDPLFTTGLVLEYAIPTAVASLMWVGICHADMPTGISIVLLDTLLSPIVIPATLKLLVGSVVEMDALGMLGDLMKMVAIPAVAAMLLQQFKPAVTQGLKLRLTPLSRLAMFLLIAANAAECAPFLRQLDATLVKVMAVVFLLCLAGFLAGYLSAKALGLPYATRLSMCFCCGMRNISAGAVLAARYFPPQVLFPVAFSPLFLQLTTSVVAKILQKLPSAPK